MDYSHEEYNKSDKIKIELTALIFYLSNYLSSMFNKSLLNNTNQYIALVSLQN